MFVVSKILLLNPNFLLLHFGGSGEESLVNTVHHIHATLFCGLDCGIGLTSAKLVVFNSCALFLKPWYELLQIPYNCVMVLLWHSINKVLEIISSLFYFYGRLDFVFHGTIPILGT